MAYAMTVHTPLGDERFTLTLPTENNHGSATMFKGSLDFTFSNVSQSTYTMSAETNVPFDCVVKVICTVNDNLLCGEVILIDPLTGKQMLGSPIDGSISDNTAPWSSQ